MDRPTGLPLVLVLECRSHLDLGDLPNLLAAELGVMTVRLERAIRSLDGVARVHVNRWGDGAAHLHIWFLARPYGLLQLRGTFLSLWDDILPTIPERQWRENLALVAAWLAEFGGHANAEPPHIQWQSPSTITVSPMASAATEYTGASHTGQSAGESSVNETFAGSADDTTVLTARSAGFAVGADGDITVAPAAEYDDIDLALEDSSESDPAVGADDSAMDADGSDVTKSDSSTATSPEQGSAGGASRLSERGDAQESRSEARSKADTSGPAGDSARGSSEDSSPSTLFIPHQGGAKPASPASADGSGTSGHLIDTASSRESE